MGCVRFCFFFFNDTATTEIYTLSLHDALPIEPVIREALERLAPPVLTGEDGVPGVVGGYWTRTNNPEIDLVVGDRSPVAKRVLALGSIKWLENAPFDRHDLGELHAHRTQLPGAAVDTP